MSFVLVLSGDRGKTEMRQMPRSLWLLMLGILISMTGSSFLWPLNAIYIHDYLGKTMFVAGLALMFNSGASVLGNLLGGYLYDKFGGYRTILCGILLSITALTGMNFWNGWPCYIIFLAFLGFGGGITYPAMLALAGNVWKEGGRRSFNAMYVAQNVGVAVGSALGGMIASFSFQYIFLANLMMYICYFLLAFFGYKNISTRSGLTATVEQVRKPHNDKSKLFTLAIISVAYLIGWVCYVQWQSTISAYTQEINISLRQYSFLWTVNGALIVLGQPILQGILRRFGDHNLKGQILTGFSIFILSFSIVSVAGQFPYFVLGMIVLTIGEMLIWPAVPTIAHQLAPKGKEGTYQGIVNSMATGGRMIGPVIGGLLVDLYGIKMLFGVLIMFLVISFLLTSIYDLPIKREINAQKKDNEFSI